VFLNLVIDCRQPNRHRPFGFQAPSRHDGQWVTWDSFGNALRDF
jgi:hypothetical protein